MQSLSTAFPREPRYGLWGGCGRRGFVGRCAALCGAAAVGEAAAWSAPPAASADDLQRARRDFDALASAARRLDFEARVDFVNMAVNQRVEFRHDDASMAGADDWATPCETLARGAGDCEDFAIVKFYLLLDRAPAGSDERLRLLYARFAAPDGVAAPVPHMVAVARRPFVDPWVLDCLNPLLVSLSRRDDLEPVFSFDELTLWRAVDASPLQPRRRPIAIWQATAVRAREQLQ